MSEHYTDSADYMDLSTELSWMNIQELENTANSLENGEYFQLKNKKLSEEIRILVEEDNQKIMSIVNFIKWKIYTQEFFVNIHRESNFLIQKYKNFLGWIKLQNGNPCDVEIKLT